MLLILLQLLCFFLGGGSVAYLQKGPSVGPSVVIFPSHLSLELVGEGAGDLEGDQVLDPGGDIEGCRFRALLTLS